MRKIFLLTLLSSFSFFLKSQNPIIIDGNFDDWENRQLIYVDTLDQQYKLWAESDEQFLFLSFELNSEIELQENNSLELFLDTDNNPSTGYSVENIGADLVYEFGERKGNLWTRGSAVQIFHNDIGLFTGPTVTSQRFEIAVRKDEIFYNENIFSSSKINILLRDNQLGVFQSMGSVEYELSETDLGDLPEWTFEKKNPADIRILSYNVERDAFFDLSKQPSFRRLIQATRPDILAFQEIYDNNAQKTANLINQWLPLPNGEQWHFSEVQPDIKIVSRFPILREQLIQGGGSGSAGNGAFLIDLGDDYHTNLMLVNSHLPCCSNETNRQAEIDEIMGFIRDSKAETSSIPLFENTPIVIVGDMNLVGESQQLETFITGDIINEFTSGEDFAPDWDFTDFEDATPPTTGYPAAFTWFNEFSSFNPGRLDFVFYTGSVLELKNSFSLFTRPLSSNLLQSNGLFSEDAIAASDHFPVITDFEVKNISPSGNLVKTDFQFEATPNPFSDKLSGSFYLKKAEDVSLSLFDLTGREVEMIFNEKFVQGKHEFNFSKPNLAPGVYFLNLKTSTDSSIYKIVKK